MDSESCDHSNYKAVINDGSAVYICRRCDATISPPSRKGFPMLSASVTPTKKGAARAIQIDKTEAGWQKDIPAYVRLRKQGYQPVGIDGSAKMESEATTRFEIESGKLMLGEEKKIAEAIDIVQSSGASDIFTPVTTPKSEVA
jgi:hypothetical protein